jgi:hypothetical protein
MSTSKTGPIAVLVAVLTLSAACGAEPISRVASDGPIRVEITEHEGGYRLLRDGRPYAVRGAGLEAADLATFAAHGGTSIRTWTTQDARTLLDDAHRLGLTVSLCLWLEHERHGFDYDDEAAVAAQFEAMKAEVLKYKDHPALLTWILGNELNFDFTNPRVFDAVNDLARFIDEVDGKHPTTTALTGFSPETVALVHDRAPDLDFLSFQMYGDLVNLPRYLRESGYERPIFITEWGAIGHWEVHRTPWGAPVEPDSTAKAANYLKSHRQVIEPYPRQVLGSYVFLWGQKQEKTPTWYGMFTPGGAKTETIDVMHRIWTGEWPENRAPTVVSLSLDGRDAYQGVRLSAGRRYPAVFRVEDPDGDEPRYRWEIKPESGAQGVGGDREADIPSLPGLIDGGEGPAIDLTAPAGSGAYRLFVYAYDGAGSAAHANIPFYVEQEF